MLLFQSLSKEPSSIHRSFLEHHRANCETVDRIFVKLLIAQWLFAIVCAVLVSPKAWSGIDSSVHPHVWSAIFLGGAITSLPCVLGYVFPGQTLTRMVIATAQLMYSALLIHLMGGRLEAHFHVFVSLALLAAYRDRSVFVPAVLFTMADHAIRGWLWPQSVYGVLSAAPWRTLEHGAWVAFEVASLSFLIQQNLNQLLKLSRAQRKLLEQRDLLESRVNERTRELWESKQFTEQILNSIEARICILAPDGTIQFVNDRWMQFGLESGAPPESIGVGANYLDVCEKASSSIIEESSRIGEGIRAVCAGSIDSYSDDYQCDGPEDSRWFHVQVNSVRLAGKTAIAVVHVDVSETRQAQSHASSIARMLQNSPNEVFIADAKTMKFVEVNQGACQNLGYSREELLAMSPAEINRKMDPAQLAEVVDQLRAAWGRVVSLECVHRRKDGTEYYCAVDLHCSHLDGREVIVAFVRDQTERIQLENRLRQAKKLEAVGQLAAGVAHEINTPMQCVFSNVEFIQRSFERLLTLSDHCTEMLDGQKLDWETRQQEFHRLRQECRYDYLRSETPKAITDAAEASSRVISIVRAMKIMSHPGTDKKTCTDLHELIENASTLTRNRWKYVAKIEFDFDPELQAIDLLPAEISQTFINMFVNAADAIVAKVGEDPAERGLISVRTQVIEDKVANPVFGLRRRNAARHSGSNL